MTNKVPFIEPFILPMIANRFKLKTYGNAKGADLHLLINSLTSVSVTRNSTDDCTKVKLVFEDSGLYTNLFNTLFKRGVVSLVEIELMGSGDTATKVLSIEGIRSMFIENNLCYSADGCSEIEVHIEASKVYQHNTEESVKLFPKTSNE